jgi:hypothetical protein
MASFSDDWTAPRLVFSKYSAVLCKGTIEKDKAYPEIV